jgi:large subunit ribosomal protein L23
MTTPYEIILRPVMTEKSTELSELENQVTFRVKDNATKPQIKSAVERLFGVKVDRVNTMVMPGKPKRVGRSMGRRGAWKKAIVQLAEGEAIDFYALEGPGEEHGTV